MMGDWMKRMVFRQPHLKSGSARHSKSDKGVKRSTDKVLSIFLSVLHISPVRSSLSGLPNKNCHPATPVAVARVVGAACTQGAES